MAQRFGGRFSPGGPTASPGASPSDTGPVPAHRRPLARHPLEGRPFWITLAAAPFLLDAFGAGPVALGRALGAFALIAASGWLMREGLRAELAWLARPVARRPAVPRKIIAAFGYGAGITLGAQAPEMGLVGAILAGGISIILALVAFGLDPMKNKGMEGIDPFQQDRVARVLAEGEKHLTAMREAIARAADPRLSARVEALAATPRELFAAVEQDPGDLSAARRYLTVYLEGARDATARFADLWAQSRDTRARADYEALLGDLEANFTARTQSLIENGRDGLEVEIEVLRDRLAREGLRPRNGG